MATEDIEILLAFARFRRLLNLRATEALKPHGIGPKQALLLRELSERDEVCLSDLARLTQSDPGATGKAIEKLIRKGWVQKSDNPVDGRRWKVSLSKAGRGQIVKLRGTYRKVAAECFSPLSGAEKEIFHKQLIKLAENIYDK